MQTDSEPGASDELLWCGNGPFTHTEAVSLALVYDVLVRTGSPSVKVSLYNRPGKGLILVMVNLGPAPPCREHWLRRSQ